MTPRRFVRWKHILITASALFLGVWAIRLAWVEQRPGKEAGSTPFQQKTEEEVFVQTPPAPVAGPQASSGGSAAARPNGASGSDTEKECAEFLSWVEKYRLAAEPDRPGLLANVSALIGQMGANIVEVAHNRLALDVPAKGAEFDIMIETRDARHTEEIIEALRARGYPPRAV